MFLLHVHGNRKRGGEAEYFHNEDFQFRDRGVVLGEERGEQVCMARVELHDYAVDGLRAGQMDGQERPIWSVDVALDNGGGQ